MNYKTHLFAANIFPGLCKPDAYSKRKFMLVAHGFFKLC